jgi:GNAT superfamily N-acetyltransferase
MCCRKGPENPGLRTHNETRKELSHKAIEYGLLTGDEGTRLAKLLLQERISVAGRVDPAIYRAFIEDALEERGPHIMVVKACGRIVGWSIGVINSRRYWISFLVRHPVAGIRILSGLCLQRYRQHKETRRVWTSYEERESELPRWPPADPNSWGKNGRHTARLIDTTVLPSLRGTGLGSKLQYHHLRELRRLGILRAEAYVRVEKSGWLRFNARSGFKVVGKKTHSLLIANDLEESSGDDG